METYVTESRWGNFLKDFESVTVLYCTMCNVPSQRGTSRHKTAKLLSTLVHYISDNGNPLNKQKVIVRQRASELVTFCLCLGQVGLLCSVMLKTYNII